MDEPAAGLRRRFPSQSRFFFYFLLFLALFLTWLVVKPFIVYTFSGAFVAVLALPIDRFWERVLRKRQQTNARKAKRRDRLAAGLTILTLVLLLAIPTGFVVYLLSLEVQDFARAVQRGALDTGLDHALEIVRPDLNETQRNETRTQIFDDLGRRAREYAGEAGAAAPGIVGNVLVALTVILFVVYYLLIDGGQLVAYLRRISPLPPAQFDYLLAEAHRGAVAVFVGQMLTSGIQGAIAGIGYFIAQVPGALLWALVTAVVSLIPAVGTAIVWIPATIYLFAVGKVWQAVFLALWGTLVVSQVDNVLRPKLIGYKSQIHPVFVLIGVLGGVAAFGFIGLFLGPLLVGVTLSVLRVWEREYRDPAIEGQPLPSEEAPAPHDAGE